MTNNNEESPFDKGVRLGYILSYKNPKALMILLALSPTYSKTYKGLIAGQKEFKRHKKIITVDEWKQQERQEKLKQIAAQEKETEQNDFER